MDASDNPTDGAAAGNPPKRRRIVQNQSHRSNNACRRCKVKKANYTAALEERVAFLEGQLAERDANMTQTHPQPAPNSAAVNSPHLQAPFQSPANTINGHDFNAPMPCAVSVASNVQQSPEKLELRSSNQATVTVFTLLEAGSQDRRNNLPELPSPEIADALFESAYLYTQARYCIVDWAIVKQWHNDRVEICSGAQFGQGPSKIGAFFLWIVYAIGARLIPTTKHLSSRYYDYALTYLRVVHDADNLLTVQGLLALIQYHCRATCGPSPWHLAGVTLRICIEKGYHRQASDPTLTEYEKEARKRTFWCAYVFDRMISIALQRPFGLDDRDIDLEEPINVDIFCMDPAGLDEARRTNSHQLTSMSFALHHLRIYRFKSRISRLSRPQAFGASNQEILQLLGELDDWRLEVPTRTDDHSIPQQNEDRTQAMYLQTALLLIRPVLCRDIVDHDLIVRFATIAADACENGKEICFRAQSHTSAIQMYNSFYCGITLLQCLALKPDALPFRRVLRAIKACSNTLAVYTSSVDAASTLARLFDKLSDHRFSDVDSSVIRPGSPSAIVFLRKVAFSDPSQAESLLQAVPDDEDTVVSGAENMDALLTLTEPMGASQWLNWEDPFASFEFNDFELS
ncbi:hypothetical protein M409DRAFT_57430 [Zasmidium cellare ATCC 36951]|uniref:Xylanolytic transcriptional activator regulatory domain-containing protein n=1 Tax=Zasmidium cellare ATCC 36951 TaxID=1080233 RepID=A0A6A6C9P1_ZASCE|nr:uncharacterized protein M409DRAFT_57430 [Zasmidium cellare ATCC 36951]KAF2163543.1 hypothetical protein M409DRAFT_57430 [Zasmidium cellare ATCC 36951]